MSLPLHPRPIGSSAVHSWRTFMLGGLTALLCAQLLYGVLVLSALHKQYVKPMLAVQALVCEELGNRLGRMTRLGKEPGRINRLEEILAPYAGAAADSLLVLDSQGRVLAGWGATPGDVFSFPAQSRQLQGQIREFSQHGRLWLTQPLTDREAVVVGHVLLGMDDAKRSEQVWRILADNIRLLGGITLVAAVLLVVLVRRVCPKPEQTLSADNSFPRKRLYACLVAPLVAGQILFAVAMLGPLRDMNEMHFDAVARQLGRHLGGELEHLLRLGLTLDQIPPVSGHLSSLQRFLPESMGLGIMDDHGVSLHRADANGELSLPLWSRLEQNALITDTPLAGPAGESAGSVRVLMSPQTISTNLRAITLDTLTMTVVAVLFLVELVNLLIMREERRVIPQAPPLATSSAFMRPVIFLCMFAIDLSLSFVPLRLGELNPNLFGLPPDVVLGLPVSAEMFMVGLAIMLGGFWSEKAGWRPLLLAGVAVVALGNLASGLTAHPLLYIASRGLAGAGYGLLNLAAQLFVLANSRPDQRAGNLAAVFAGLFAGALCGSASGGLIADRLGYAAVFLVAAALLALTGLILWRVLPRQDRIISDRISTPKTQPSWRDILTFVTDPRMAALLFLNIVPSAFVTVCLFQFFVPVSLHQGGASPADIGRVVMIFPLVIVYLGPLFGRLVDRSRHKYRPLALAGLIAAGGVAVLLPTDGILAATLAVLLLGLSNAILSNAQGAYALELPATQRFGSARAMGLYNVAERLGQVIGPVSLGTVLAVWGRDAGLGVMAVGFAAMSIVFVVVSSRREAKI